MILKVERRQRSATLRGPGALLPRGKKKKKNPNHPILGFGWFVFLMALPLAAAASPWPGNAEPPRCGLQLPPLAPPRRPLRSGRALGGQGGGSGLPPPQPPGAFYGNGAITGLKSQKLLAPAAGSVRGGGRFSGSLGVGALQRLVSVEREVRSGVCVWVLFGLFGGDFFLV